MNNNNNIISFFLSCFSLSLLAALVLIVLLLWFIFRFISYQTNKQINMRGQVDDNRRRTSRQERLLIKICGLSMRFENFFFVLSLVIIISRTSSSSSSSSSYIYLFLALSINKYLLRFYREQVSLEHMKNCVCGRL